MSEIDCLKRCGDESAIAGLPDLNTQPQLQEIGKNKNFETLRSGSTCYYGPDIAGLVWGYLPCISDNDMHYLSSPLAYSQPTTAIILQHFYTDFLSLYFSYSECSIINTLAQAL